LEYNEKTIIFYFTGTGNSLHVAKKISRNFEQVDLIAVPKVIAEEQYNYEEYVSVGVVVPLYFMGMPKLVYEFLYKLNIPDALYIFCIVTRAYTKGMVFSELDKILISKGKGLDYGRYISLPDSYIRWAGARDKEVQKKLLEESDKQIEIIKKDIFDNKKHIDKEGILLKTSSYTVNRIWKSTLKTKNKTFKISDDCIQCGICVKVCPSQNVELDGELIKWGEKCQDCMACVQNCPKKAIYFSRKTKNRRRYRNPNISVEELFYW
jgi:ferredoxin